MRLFLKQLVAGILLAGLGGLVQAAELTVSAASSLTNAFREIARDYQAAHTGVKVQLNFGGSGALLQQIAKGAPVDLFASADQETMDRAERQGLIASDTRQDFARNALVLIVPHDSVLPLTRLADLTRPGIERIAIGNPASVPVGRYSRQALESEQLWEVLQSRLINTQNVRQALDYVARGEVQAGFVYATDAAVMPDTVRVAFAVPLAATISYPIAVTRDAAQADEARRFLAYLRSPAGQALLARHGFQVP